MRQYEHLLTFACLAVYIVALASFPDLKHRAREPADRIPAVPRLVGDPIEIALLGTSLTASSSWPRYLEEHLSTCLRQRLIVRSFARTAATSSWGLDQATQASDANADAVIIEFAINDADVKIGMPLNESRALHNSLIQRILDDNPRSAIFLMTTNPALGRAGGRRPALGAYYAMYRELSKEAGVGLVDINRRWLALDHLSSKLPDGLHPTQKASEEIIVPALAQILAAVFHRSEADC